MANKYDPWDNIEIILRFFNTYYTIFIIILGLLGNSLSIAVILSTNSILHKSGFNKNFKLRKRKVRNTSSWPCSSYYYYLAAVAMADSGFLICLFIVWLTYLNINLYNRNGICQIVVYLTYVFSFVSVWLIVAFTIERFIAIYFPFQRPSVCTVKRAKMNIIIIVTIGFILYPFILFSAGIIYPIKEENLYKTYNYSLNNDKIIMAYYKFTNDNRTRANINDNNISSNSWIIFRSHINIYDKRHHFYSNSNLYFEKTIYHNESQIKTYKFMESGSKPFLE
ncbi:unnamed protein product [Gordionus sp. m RMFG-2023]